MLIGERIRLRPFREDEREMIEDWLEDRERGIGPWQPYLLGQGSEVREALGGAVLRRDMARSGTIWLAAGGVENRWLRR